MELELRQETERRQRMIYAALGKDLRQSRQQSGTTYRPRNTYATGRRPCARWMALDLLHPEDRGDFSDDVLARLERGNQRERSIIAQLQRAGEVAEVPFEITEGQKRFEIKDRDGAVIVTGKIDGKIRFRDGFKATFDTKAGDSFRNMTTVDELLGNPWTWASVFQLCVYMLQENEPSGFLILDRSGLPLMVPVILEEHLAETEAFLQEARLAWEARNTEGANLPAFAQNPATCRRCPHLNKSCSPPTISFGTGVVLISDEDLIQQAEFWIKHRDIAKAAGKAWDVLKDALRGIEHGILGPFEVSGKWSKSTSYEIPPEIKAPYKVVDPQGRFVLNVEPVTATQEGGEVAPPAQLPSKPTAPGDDSSKGSTAGGGQ
jgi:hypothetical protein